jgi:outer membrane immunogenic protein
VIARKFTLALLATAAIGLAGAAHAADVYSPPADPVYAPEPAAFSWTGIYFGANGGYGGNRFTYPYAYLEDFGEELEITGDFSLTSSGFVAGGQVGGQIQAGSMLFGIEADIQWANILGQLEVTNDQIGLVLDLGSRVNWYGTIRGRAGVLLTPRFLAYATGGVAYGEVESFYTGEFLFQPFDGSTKQYQWGWTAGGGFEYAITDHVTFKTEYLFVDLGENELIDADFGDGDTFNLDVLTKFHTVKAGFNFLW